VIVTGPLSPPQPRNYILFYADLIHGPGGAAMSAATGTMFMAAAQTGADASLSTRLAVHRNFEPFQLRSDVELFSVERESPSL